MISARLARLATTPLLLAALLSPSARASCDPPIGGFTSIENAVEVQREGEARWLSASLGETLCQGDTVRVGPRSRAALHMRDGVVLRLDQNTTMRMVNVAARPEERSVLELLAGALQSFSRRPRDLAVNTPYLNGLIEGTEFIARVEAGEASLLVLEGRVRVENPLGTASVPEGHVATAGAASAPVERLVARPRDAVQWSLHYPSVISSAADPATMEPGAPRPAWTAQQLLAVGRADEARAELDRALGAAPEDAESLALMSIILLAQNERDSARELAERAVASAPRSAAALIALSYAQQAGFDLEAAVASLERAVQIEPDNALAWARLAELRSSFGRLEPALEAATRAAKLDPRISRTKTVLGFVQLLRVDTPAARSSFEAAIALDSADPLPRLGLGLAHIAEGELEAGRGEIDVAASLDPNQSIIRSYLGKAYFEEKRAPLDEQQFSIAKELDSNDPTPWFYNAIALQTSNRPGESLQELRRAIELNDNRAVYRSRMLLDSDLAARSASLARVFGDLGFQQLALVEGWKSVNTDPANFSAHRFLADSYAALPRHEIARVSELLQSQLLQPLSLTPIQPHLAESDLFLVSAGGPGVLAFNEFNPLFRRDGYQFQVSALGGGNDTASGEAVISGTGGKFAYSLGAFHYETDGFRGNADQDDDIFNAFAQLEISPDTSLQAEYRYRDSEIGDLQLRFFPRQFRPGSRTPSETHSVRVGLRHAFAPDSVLLGSVIYSDAEYGAFDTEPPIAPGFITFIGLDEPQESLGGELQHLWHGERFSLTTGAGYFDRDGDSTLTLNTVLPPPDDVWSFPPDDLDLRHANVYGYLYGRLSEALTVTLGLSGEFVDQGSAAVSADDEYNPKFGLMWSPARDTLVRLAAFRTTKRPVIANQTLEPTQVAGFNQFFDDFNQTTGWRYGAALDQTFCSTLYGGIELSRRDLEVPASDQFGVPTEADWDEDLARTYLFWLPDPRWALRAGYEFERVQRALELTDGVKDMDTVRVPLGASYLHPNGLGLSLNATWYDQDGTFESIWNGRLKEGDDSFWIADLTLSYRLPKRYGIVSVGVANIFDEKFRYFDTDFNNPRIQPERVVTAAVTLALP